MTEQQQGQQKKEKRGKKRERIFSKLYHSNARDSLDRSHMETSERFSQAMEMNDQCCMYIHIPVSVLRAHWFSNVF